jgi:hypothetical protein
MRHDPESLFVGQAEARRIYMKSRWIPIAAVAAMVFAVRASTGSASPVAEAAPGLATVTSSSGPEVALASWCGPRLESIRYRPRARYRERDYDGGSHARGFSQVHAGFFDPDKDPPSAVLFGIRGGTSIDDRIQLGVGLDWSHRSNRVAVLVREVPLPGGGTAERQPVLARSSSNLLPMMAFLQVTPGIDLPVTPYFGIGGGYEVLFLSAEGVRPEDNFDATYGGWGWQVWGGAALPLSGRSRFNAEVFLNNSELDRDIDDPETGSTREVVPMDGIGMRFGLSWGF